MIIHHDILRYDNVIIIKIQSLIIHRDANFEQNFFLDWLIFLALNCLLIPNTFPIVANSRSVSVEFRSASAIQQRKLNSIAGNTESSVATNNQKLLGSSEETQSTSLQMSKTASGLLIGQDNQNIAIVPMDAKQRNLSNLRTANDALSRPPIVSLNNKVCLSITPVTTYIIHKIRVPFAN